MHATAIADLFSNGLGQGGIGLGLLLNGLGVPGLSEVLLPLSGALVRQGNLDLASLVAVALVAQMIGLVIAYFIARYGGVALVEKYGRYVLLSHKELARSQRAFDSYGVWLVFVGSFAPGLQGAVGYVAGLAEMNLAKFLVAATLGKIIWVGALIYLGIILGNNLDLIDRSIKQIGVIVLAAVIIAIIWYIRGKRRIREH